MDGPPPPSSPTAASAADCSGLSASGFDGSIRRPASGSRRRARTETPTSPLSPSAFSAAGVVPSSRTSCVIQPPPSRTTWS